MARAARCNPPRSVLRFLPQRIEISYAAYSILPHSVRQSSHNVLQFFTLRTAILYIAYRNFPHSVQKFFTQHTAIFHTAYSNSSHSVLQSSPQRTAILHTAYSNPPRSIQQFSPPLIEISVCSLLMAIQRLLMCIQRLQTEILAVVLIHFFRVLGRVKKAVRGDMEYTLHADIDVLGRIGKAARGVFLRFFLLFIRLCGGL